MSIESYFIPVNISIFELNVKKSIFIAKAQFVDNTLIVRDIIKQEKQAHKGYTHVVHGFRIGKPNSETCGMSDDGEPSHTAGKPVLNIIQKSNVSNVIITVVRYFGGIKLGTGGLVRAYTDSAKGCFEKLVLREIKDIE
ncbi:MAG: YigZ family protein, partial [Candidatus Muirbacterium halophilum]|nr:YigZ family protein [Candidatus Muirbacterium halophilum]